jgi:K+-transporting ATPase ATPase A chain
MSLPNLAQYGLFLVVVMLLVKPLGGYLMRVFTGQKTLLDILCAPVEGAIYRLAGIDANQQMEAKHYSIAFVLFSLTGTLGLYGILRL